MDLSTMKRKLDNSEYPNAEAFHRDFKLLISNCYAYNPPGTDVNRMGQGLDAVFEAKWLDKPEPYSEYGSGSGSSNASCRACRSDAVGNRV
jgi:bromodomain-containing factor 1